MGDYFILAKKKENDKIEVTIKKDTYLHEIYRLILLLINKILLIKGSNSNIHEFLKELEEDYNVCYNGKADN